MAAAAPRLAPDSTHLAPHNNSKISSSIPTVQEATLGGVWQTSSAKRDKLAELRTESAGTHAAAAAFDDRSPPDYLVLAATERQKLDIYLVDGLQLIAKHAETALIINTTDDDDDNRNTLTLSMKQSPLVKDLIDWVEQQQQQQTMIAAADGTNDELDQAQWDVLLQQISQKLNQALAALPSGPGLRFARDYVDASEHVQPMDLPGFQAWLQQQQPPQSRSATAMTAAAGEEVEDYDASTRFAHASLRFRLQTTVAVLTHLQESWKIWTTVTDQDVDRAAVRHEESILATNYTSLSRRKLVAVLQAYLCGNGNDRINALWDLMDKDSDGLLDQVEMNHVCTSALVPAQRALPQLLQEALDAVPLHTSAAAVFGGEENLVDRNVTKTAGWWQRRQQKSEKKRWTKLFQKTLRKHFVDELEMSHRLRCIYAWANKAHQNNKIDSVLVEENDGGIVTGVVGRKRYVELQPKIAVTEFRPVQSLHFPQLDRVGQEYLHSLREDLLIQQGKGRQNRELLRDSSLFFTAVCVIDYIVLSL